MRIPSLPVFIDEFPAGPRASNGSGSSRDDGLRICLLTHFHTDHMKGLHDAWTGGLLLTSPITAQLLLHKYSGLRGRVVEVPLFCRVPLIAQWTPGSQSSSNRAVVEILLLPSFHIPGSVMIYLVMPGGESYLHTGDFKFTTDAHAALASFFAAHPVDHVFLDDTWLHLGQPTTAAATGGTQIASKLLDAAQVEEAVEAIGRRMNHQRRLYDQQMQQQQQQRRRLSTAAMDQMSDGCASAASESPNPTCRQLPFVLRIYLHNQFGKELLIQRLAERLSTRALIDDARYARLEVVARGLQEEQEDLKVFASEQSSATPLPLSTASSHASLLSSFASEALAPPPPSRWEAAWRASGGEAARYPIQLDYFVSHSQYEQQQQSCGVSAEPAPLIEVVSSRSSISTTALSAAAAANGTPYYGVVMSGWAQLQTVAPTENGAAAQLWQVPTTLHCTPQECIDFIALLRPRSITPLHYRPSRGAVVMQRLGPHLRIPFSNQHGRRPSELLQSGEAAQEKWRWKCVLPGHLLESIGLPHTEAACPIRTAQPRGYRFHREERPRGDAMQQLSTSAAAKRKREEVETGVVDEPVVTALLPHWWMLELFHRHHQNHRHVQQQRLETDGHNNPDSRGAAGEAMSSEISLSSLADAIL